MKEIYLTQGMVAIVDDEDYDWINGFNWHYHKGYADRSKRINGKVTKIKMHREITKKKYGIEEIPKGIYCDHINGNSLDNRRSNLRFATPKENVRNQKGCKSEKSTSKYKGVTLKRKLWSVVIGVDNQILPLGSFKNEIAAANCYNHWAKHYFGEFARLNDCPVVEDWEQYRYRKLSKYRGVTLDKNKKTKVWVARIQDPKTKKLISLGCYDTEDEAGLAYNKKAIELYGENFSYLNRINEEEEINEKEN